MEELDQVTEKLNTDTQQVIWENTKSIKRKTAGNNYPTEIRNIVAGKRT